MAIKFCKNRRGIVVFTLLFFGLTSLVLLGPAAHWLDQKKVSNERDEEAAFSRQTESTVQTIARSNRMKSGSGQSKAEARAIFGSSPSPQESVVDQVQKANFRSDYDVLVDNSKGNPELAFALASHIKACQFVDTSYVAIDHALSARTLSVEAASEKVSELDVKFGNCAGLPADNAAVVFDLAGRAADAGILDAQLNYRYLAGDYFTSQGGLRSPQMLQDFISNTERHLRQAASTGDRDAQYRAFELYSDGLLLEPNPALAYHYLQEFHRLKPSPLTQASLDQYLDSLPPEVREQLERPGG